MTKVKTKTVTSLNLPTEKLEILSDLRWAKRTTLPAIILEVFDLYIEQNKEFLQNYRKAKSPLEITTNRKKVRGLNWLKEANREDEIAPIKPQEIVTPVKPSEELFTQTPAEPEKPVFIWETSQKQNPPDQPPRQIKP